MGAGLAGGFASGHPEVGGHDRRGDTAGTAVRTTFHGKSCSCSSISATEADEVRYNGGCVYYLGMLRVLM